MLSRVPKKIQKQFPLYKDYDIDREQPMTTEQRATSRTSKLKEFCTSAEYKNALIEIANVGESRSIKNQLAENELQSVKVIIFIFSIS